MTQTTPPGWYPDPQTLGMLRYWDGNQWTASQAPASGTAPIPPVPKGGSLGRGCLIAFLAVVGMIALVGIVVFVAGGITTTSDKPASRPIPASGLPPSSGPRPVFFSGNNVAASGVRVTSCAPAGQFFDVKGTATNMTSKRSEYQIHISIRTADDKQQIGFSAAVAENVKPGQTSPWDGPTLVKSQPGGAVCEVLTVDRLAYP